MASWFLCDDPESRRLRPLTWLRPASALRLGAATLSERWTRLLPGEEVFVVVRDSLVGVERGWIGWKDAAERAKSAADAIWVRDTVVPSPATVAALRQGAARGLGQGATVIAFRTSGATSDTVASAIAGGEDPFVARPPVGSGPEEITGIERLVGLGDLVRLQPLLLAQDLEQLLADPPWPPGRSGDGFVYAPERVFVHPSARVDHGAVLDARDGAIVLGPGTIVHPGTYLRGPLHAAARCLFLGGTIGVGSSFGPVSRVRGEVETTVFLGHANKAHEGFVGHSYVGEWVNLGALTTTSDLKNDYGEVTLEVDGERIATGSKKVGAFFGDHAKTRIGCLLNTGTVVGLGANVFGGPPVSERAIADFQWGTGDEAREYRIDKFLQVARTVLDRRGVAWSATYEGALREAFDATAPARRQRWGDA